MNKITALAACLSYAVALLAGTFESHLGAIDCLDDDDTPLLFEMPYTWLVLRIITVVAGLLAATGIYLIAADITHSSVNGVFAAVTAWTLRPALSRWCAQSLYALKAENAAPLSSSW